MVVYRDDQKSFDICLSGKGGSFLTNSQEIIRLGALTFHEIRHNL